MNNTPEGLAARTPPGQALTTKWPVLTYGLTPRVNPKTWTFRCFGLVEEEVTWTWDEFLKLPRTEVACDIHCVTRWSRLDMDFEGVAIQTILERAKLKPEARFVVAHAEQGYTANLPLAVLDDEDVILADIADGAPLTPDHGYPLRLVVPKRYFWKSAKWVRGLQFVPADRPGFWERYGYHNDADPWKEERFSDG